LLSELDLILVGIYADQKLPFKVSSADIVINKCDWKVKENEQTVHVFIFIFAKGYLPLLLK